METDSGKVQITIDQAKEKVEDGEMILKMLESKEWKRIIDKCYFEEEALRLVDSVGNLALTDQQRANLQTLMIGIPAIKNFLNFKLGEARQASGDIKEFEEEAGRIDDD